MAQNIIELGIDVSSFSSEKEAVLNRYINLFNQLDAHANKTYNPILGTGLTEFNASLTATSKILDDINAKILNIGTGNGGIKAATSSTKDYTEAEKQLLKQLEEEEALMKKLNALTTDQAKANMALKLQLSELTKAHLEEAKAGNASVQQKLADKKATQDKAAADAKAVKDAKQANADRVKADADTERASRKKEAASKANVRATQQESAANKVLTNDLAILKKAFDDQAVRYGNLHLNKGANAPETKEALANLNTTGALIANVDKKIQGANGSVKLFGGALSSAFGSLRTIAYILPGIGIAGIFNLAFEAIGKAASELGIFTNKFDELLKRETKENEILLEKFNLLKDIYDQQEKLYQEASPESSTRLKSSNENLAAEGIPKALELQNKIDENRLRLGEISKNLHIDSYSDINKLETTIAKRIDAQQDLTHRITQLSEIINAKDERGFFEKGANAIRPYVQLLPDSKAAIGLISKKRVAGVDYSQDDEQLKIILDKRKSNLELEKAQNDKDIRDYTDFITTRDHLEKSANELTKFNLDEERKIRIQAAKDRVSINQDINQKVLSDEISSYNDRKRALEGIKADKVKSANIDLDDVLSNNQSGRSDIANARSKRNADIKKADIDFKSDFIKLNEEYRQRELTAELTSAEKEVKQNAVKNEKIANNEEHSLQERLQALSNYISQNETLQDLQLARDLQRRSLEAKGPVPKKEREALEKSAFEQKANIQADVEKKAYEIVYQYTEKELQLVKDANDLEDGQEKEKYTRELEAVNKRFSTKKIKYAKYKEEIAEVDNKFSRIQLEGAVKDDIADLERIKDHNQKLRVAERESGGQADTAKLALDADPKNLELKKDFDTKFGIHDAYAKALKKSEKAETEERNKLRDDEYKLAAKAYKKDVDKRKEVLQAIQQIEQSIYNAVKTIVDQEYDYKIARSQAIQQVIDEQYQSEIAAIEKSSLSAKDKAALDIQLNAQQIQSDREAKREQKKEAHDKAVFDKEIGITHILLSTAVAVAELIATPWLAIAAGVAGAAELAVASSLKIPSYEKGTGSMSHPGGYALTGEHGIPEIIKEPYKSPYLVMKENISYLPSGTRVIPIEDSPEFNSVSKDHSWEQTRYLAKQIAKNKPKSPSIRNEIFIDLGFEQYKFKKLFG